MSKYRIFIALACIAIGVFTYLANGGSVPGSGSTTSSTPKDSL